MDVPLLSSDDEGGLAAATRRLLDSYNAEAGGPLETAEFQPIGEPGAVGRVAAVDGGSCVLIDLVSCGCLSVRASHIVRKPDDSYEDGPVAERVYVVARRDAEAWWADVLAEFGWGLRADLPPARSRTTMGLWADAARSVLEYHATRSVLGGLAEGDVLLLDGSLEGEPGGPDLTTPLLQRAAERGVHVVAVSKDSARTIGGLLPFPIEVEQAAEKAGAAREFLCDVTNALGLSGHGFRTFAVRWDVRAPVLRLDVPDGDATHAAELAAVLATTCNDPTALGYPYPLARAHRRVRYTPDSVIDRRRAMEAIIAERRGTRLGMRLFGRGRELLELTN